MAQRIQFCTVGVTCAMLCIAGCAPTLVSPWNDPSLDNIQRTALQRFSSATEFNAYFRDVHKHALDRNYWWAYRQSNPAAGLLAQLEEEIECAPDDPDCAGQLQEITVSGARVKSTNQSITNNQEAGVDEGDIVKLYENFLVILQHGRLFSVDIGTAASQLRFVDRIDVYNDADNGGWYDELLISGNKLVVTGYSWNDDATEITVLSISDNGHFEKLATYFIRSEDYFSSDNYATRLVDDHLIIYTPLMMYEYDVDEGIPYPTIRQRLNDGTYTEWKPLFDATDVYWPLDPTLEPVVHTISTCPIDEGSELSCRSTGIVGGSNREFYVSPTHAYVWNIANYDAYDFFGEDLPNCAPGFEYLNYEATPAVFYKIPLFDGGTTALRTAGWPPDQFSLNEQADVFHALAIWEPYTCWLDDALPLRYVRFDMSEFSTEPTSTVAGTYTALPVSGGWRPENRFTETHFAYSDQRVSRWDFARHDVAYARADLIVVPLENPETHTRYSLGHDIQRLEVFGDGLVAMGQYSFDGLYLSSIDIDNKATVADQEYLPGYFESEGRSHAFNLRLDENGGGLFGIPITVEMPGRWRGYLRKRADVGFFDVSTDMVMQAAGLLLSAEPAEDSVYECEVSCYDWYGNTRPIFIEERIFALSGSELIEGRMVGGQIAETGRLSILGTPGQ